MQQTNKERLLAQFLTKNLYLSVEECTFTHLSKYMDPIHIKSYTISLWTVMEDYNPDALKLVHEISVGMDWYDAVTYKNELINYMEDYILVTLEYQIDDPAWWKYLCKQLKSKMTAYKHTYVKNR